MSIPSLEARRGKSIVILSVLLFFAFFGVSAFTPLTPHASASNGTAPMAPSANPAASPQPCQFGCDYITLSNEPSQCTQSSLALSLTGTWDSATHSCHFSGTSTTGFAITSDYSLVVGPGVTLVVTGAGSESAILVNPGSTLYNYGTINATGGSGGNGGNGADGNPCYVNPPTSPTNGGNGGSGGNGGAGIHNQGIINNAGTINAVAGNGGDGGDGGSGGLCEAVSLPVGPQGASGNGGNGGNGGTSIISSGGIINNATIIGTGGNAGYAGYGGTTTFMPGGNGGNGGNGGAVVSNSGTITNNIGATITGNGGNGNSGGNGADGNSGATNSNGDGGNGGAPGNGGEVVSNSGTINNYGIIGGTAGDGAYYGSNGGNGADGSTGGNGGNGGNGGDGVSNSGSINNYGSSPGLSILAQCTCYTSYNWPNPGKIIATGGNAGVGGSGGTATNPNGPNNNGAPGHSGDGGKGVSNSGIIYNYATINGAGGQGGYNQNNYGVLNSGTGFIGNLGVVIISGSGSDTFYNYGTINNDGDLTGGANGGNIISNQGTINNYCSSPVVVDDSSNQPNQISCYYAIFDPSGLPSSGANWGVTLNWVLFPVPLNITVSGYTSYYVELTGSMTYSYYTPVNESGTILDCTAGCSGSASISSDTSFSASYTTVTTTSVSCSSKFLVLLASATCTASVQGSSPTGIVTFTIVPGDSGTFTPADGKCTLDSSSSCSVTYTAVAAGPQGFSANYAGDAHNLASIGSGEVFVNLTVSITTSNGAEICSGGTFDSGHLPGTWSGSTCNIGASFSPALGETLDIGAGVTIINAQSSLADSIISNLGVINNYGTMIITGDPCPVADTAVDCYGLINEGGTINNYGIITSSGPTAGIGNYGTINNGGTMTGEGTGSSFFDNFYGILNYPDGTINNAGTMTGEGSDSLYTYLAYGINNTGTINNAGTLSGSNGHYAGIYNGGTINNYCDAPIQSNGATFTPNNSYSCHTVTFSQSGIPASGVTWGVTTAWSPSSGVTFISTDHLGTGANIPVQLTGSLTYSYDSPVTPSASTAYGCNAGCSGSSPSITEDTSFSATYTAVATSVFCSPVVVGDGQVTTCTATVQGSSSGTITFTSSSSTGVFTPSSGQCTLSAGSCSVNYTDSTIGITNITDSYHVASSLVISGKFSLTIALSITSSNGPTVCLPSGSYTNDAIPGNWSSSTSTCSSTVGFLIPHGAIIEIGTGVTLGGNLNSGSATTDVAVDNNGTIFNYGTIIGDTSGQFCGQYAWGIVAENGSVIYNYGTMTGNGNSGITAAEGGTINNAGTMNGGGSTCSGVYTSWSGFLLSYSGTINNAGTMNGIGTCAGVENGGTINNAGTITGTTTGSTCGGYGFSLSSGSVINNYCDGSLVGSLPQFSNFYINYYPSCYSVTFSQSGIPASGVTWGVTTSWSPSSGVTFIALYQTDTGTSLTVQLEGTLTYSYYTPINSSGATYNCTTNCSGTSSIAADTSLSPATYTAIITSYSVTFDQTGIPSGVTWSVTVGSNTYTGQGPIPVSNLQGTLTYSYEASVSGTTGTQYECSGTTCSGSVGVSTTIVTSTYQTQYLISFARAGPSATVNVQWDFGNDTSGTNAAPFSLWADSSTSSITFSYQTSVTGSTGVQYELTSITPSSPYSISSGPTTITGSYQTQLLVTFEEAGSNSPVSVTYSFGNTTTGTLNGITQSAPASIWVDASTSSITFTYQATVAGVTGTRYALSSIDPVSPLTIGSPATVTGMYSTQYLLTVKGGNNVQVSPASTDGWYNESTSLKVSSNWTWNLVSAQSRTAISNYQIDGVNQNPAREGSGTLTTPQITMDSTHNVTFVSVTQYYLTVNGGDGITYGTPSPTSDNWYDTGSSTTVSSNGIWGRLSGVGQRVSSWNIDGGSSTDVASLGTVTTPSVSIGTYHTVNFIDVTQYQVTLDSSATLALATITAPTISGDNYWYDSGTPVTVTLNGVFGRSGGTGTRISAYDLNGASTLVSSTGTFSPLNGVSITAPQSITTTTKAQYYLTDNNPSGAESSITPPTISGDTGWYDQNAVVTVSLNNIYGATSTQRNNLISYTVDTTATPVTRADSGTQSFNVPMGGAHTISSTYNAEFLLTVNSAYGKISITGSQTSDNWFDSGSKATFNVTSPVTCGTGCQEFFIAWTGTGTGAYSGSNNLTTITVGSPTTETASFVNQYLVTFEYMLQGGGSPTAPAVSYTSGGVSETGTASPPSSSSPTQAWVDAGTSVTYTNPLAGSGTSERWQTNLPIASSSSVIDPSVSTTETLNPTYYHQLLVSFGYTTNDVTTIDSVNNLVSYTQFGSLTQLSTDASGALSLSRDWADTGTPVTFVSPVSISPNERYQISTSDSGANTIISSVSSSSTSANPDYYHQFSVTFAYSTSDGTVSNPSVSYVQFSAGSSITATQSGVPVWVDSTSQYSYDNPISGSSSTERWIAPLTPAGTISSSTTITPKYYHQFSVTWSYITQDGSTPVPSVTLSGTQFGNPYTAGGSGSGWLDATTLASFQSSIPSSPTNERWTTSPTETITNAGYSYQTSITIGSGSTTLATEYYHQYLATASYSTSDGSTPSSSVVLTGTTFGGASTTALDTTPQTTWLDAGTGWSVNNPIVAPSTTERWYASSGTAGTISAAITISPEYDHEFLLIIATDPSGLSPSPSITPQYSSGWYSYDTPVTVTANNASGYTFIVWQVDGTNGTVLANPITITMDQTHSLVAYYEQPTNAVQSLISTINTSSLQQGTQTSLDANLNAAINSLNSGNSKTAVNQLNAFINAVNAQTGKHISASQAQLLTSFAQDIINSIAP